MRRALITGISGQDGYYLSKLLLGKGYEVHGLVRKPDATLDPRIVQHQGDVCEEASLSYALSHALPDEIYNLAALSSVSRSFLAPSYTFETNANGFLYLVQGVRDLSLRSRVYQASSSEMFGNAPPPQNEQTLLMPRSPYAVAKIAAHHTVKVYREAYGLFAVSGILFNHDSERRPESFVTRKISKAVARIKRGQQAELVLGNLDASRDWGHAEDYVEAMWRMLQVDVPEDFVIATGETHTVREFVEKAFTHAGLPWEKYVRTDTSLLRAADVPVMRGDSSKARKLLGWAPRVKFDELVHRMVEWDLRQEPG